MMRNGERVWRSPVELSLLRKRPADPERCERLLDDLEKLVRTARLPRAEPARVEVSEALAVPGGTPGATPPTSRPRCGASKRRSRPGCGRVPGGAAAAGRARLPAPRPAAGPRRQPARGGSARDRPRPGADLRRRALDADPLAHRLRAGQPARRRALRPAGRRAAAPLAPGRRPALGAGRGRLLPFDGEETIRRLRQQEERELYVHSLVYARCGMSRLPAGRTET